MEAYKPSENQEKTNEISIFAFLFSVFIYVSVFYFFRLSPLLLLHTTEFWFFLSNTLVLIIVIDYSSFSKSKQDLHEENMFHTQIRSVSVSSVVKPDEECIIRTRASKPEIEKEEEINPECEMQKLSIKTDEQAADEGVDIKVVESPRSEAVEKSEKEKEEEEEEEEISEDNEFSRMTDEELNRRVAEFIRRFKTEIRLQALTNLNQN